MSGHSGRDAASFAALLRAARRAAALTQEELAARAGLSAKAIGALERGERTRPYPHTVRALVAALGLGEVDGRALAAAAAPPTDAAVDAAAAAAAPGATRRDPEPGVATAPAPGIATSSLGPFIGRESEVARVRELVAGGRRVVTLTGPGGVGKTRLAMELVASVAPAFDDTVVVDLAPEREPTQVLRRIAAALGAVDPGSATSVEAIARGLVGRRVLAVLDNLEQVIGCATDLAALTAAAPDLVVLATSRAPLRIRAEHEVAVAPLALPPATTTPAALDASAVRLFVERCDAAGAPLSLTDETVPVVAEICRRLDGLPLAIEIAARAARLLDPVSLADRLGEVLDLAGPRDLPERQRTIGAVLDWSLGLLDPDDAGVFRALAAFSGSFGLDAAAAVAAGPGVEAALLRLVDQSLVVRAPSVVGRRRLRLLVPVRQHAMVRAHAAGEAVPAADRHATWFLGAGRAAAARLRGPELVACLDELSADLAESRAALLRLVETGRGSEAAELLHGTWLHLAIRGHAREGLAWSERLRGACDDVGEVLRLIATAGLHHAIGGPATVRAHAERALRLAGGIGRPDLVAEAAVLASAGSLFGGDLDASRRALDEGTEAAAQVPSPWRLAHLAIAEAQWSASSGRLEEAASHLDVAEATARASQDGFTLAVALNTRAASTELADAHAASAELLVEATEVSVAGSLAWPLAYALPALGGVAVALGEDDLAASFFGASAALSAGASLDPTYPASNTLAVEALARLRERMPADDLATAWDAGRLATGDEVVERARSLRNRAPA